MTVLSRYVGTSEITVPQIPYPIIPGVILSTSNQLYSDLISEYGSDFEIANLVPESVAPIESTYNAFSDGITNGTLTPGATYRIDDYATVWDRDPGNNDFGNGPIEPLLVTATSNDTYRGIVKSETHPNDIIVWDHADTVNGSSGRIQYRKDPISGIEMNADFRVVSFLWYEGSIDGETGNWAWQNTNITLGSLTMTVNPATSVYTPVIDVANSTRVLITTGYDQRIAITGTVQDVKLEDCSNLYISGNVSDVKVSNGLTNSLYTNNITNCRWDGSTPSDSNYVSCGRRNNTVNGERSNNAIYIDGDATDSVWSGIFTGNTIRRTITFLPLNIGRNTNRFYGNIINNLFANNGMVDMTFGSYLFQTVPGESNAQDPKISNNDFYIFGASSTFSVEQMDGNTVGSDFAPASTSSCNITCSSFNNNTIASNFFGVDAVCRFFDNNTFNNQLVNVDFASDATYVVTNGDLESVNFQQPLNGTSGSVITINASRTRVLVNVAITAGSTAPTLTDSKVDVIDGVQYYELGVSAGSPTATLLW